MDGKADRFRITRLEDRIAPTSSCFVSGEVLGGALTVNASAAMGDSQADNVNGNHIGENNTVTAHEGNAAKVRLATGD